MINMLETRNKSRVTAIEARRNLVILKYLLSVEKVVKPMLKAMTYPIGVKAVEVGLSLILEKAKRRPKPWKKLSQIHKLTLVGQYCDLILHQTGYTVAALTISFPDGKSSTPAQRTNLVEDIAKRLSPLTRSNNEICLYWEEAKPKEDNQKDKKLDFWHIHGLVILDVPDGQYSEADLTRAALRTKGWNIKIVPAYACLRWVCGYALKDHFTKQFLNPQNRVYISQGFTRTLRDDFLPQIRNSERLPEIDLEVEKRRWRKSGVL